MKKIVYRISIIFILALFITSCGRDKQQSESIATVNNAPVLLKEFQKEISIQSKKDPTFKITSKTLQEQLDTMIDKKLMIQEAMKMGLAENERFVDTIKTFWEQTLIRELIDAKMKEWADRIFVTDEEVQKTYQRMQYAPTVKLVKAEDKARAEDTKQRMLKGENITGEETIGPLSSEDIKIDILNNAFDMAQGEAGIFEYKNGYLVLYLIKKEKTSVPLLKDIYNQIKQSVLEQKKEKALEKWLNDIKRAAKIQVNAQILKKVTNEQ